MPQRAAHCATTNGALLRQATRRRQACWIASILLLPAMGWRLPATALSRYRDGIARHALFNNMVQFTAPKHLRLAAIAFALRRNIRLQNRVPASNDLLPDKASADATVRLPEAG